MVADITPNFNQGTIEISSNPTDMAIQGDGFFIVQGSTGEQLYTRNGVFKMNAENQLVTITGNRLLGFGVEQASSRSTRRRCSRYPDSPGLRHRGQGHREASSCKAR